MTRLSRALLAGLAFAALAGSADAATARHKKNAPAPAASSDACDRACLQAMPGRLLDAMVARTPATLPWAGTVHYSENSVPMMVGDGLWATISARSPKPLVVADPDTGGVAWFGEVEEHGQAAYLALRLKVTDGKIAEAEAVVRRKGGPTRFGDAAAYAPDPELASPATGRQARERLTALVDGYLSSVQANDGTVLTQIDPACAGVENGVSTTSGDKAEGGVDGCEAQLKAGVFAPIVRVRARRYPVVDEAAGVVVAAGFLDLPARAESFTGADGKSRPAPATYPYSVGFLTAFKIRDGRILHIETISTASPYYMPTPWPTE